MAVKSMVTISNKQRWKLMNFIKDYYIKKHVTDEDFAKFASKELKFSISKCIVANCRKDLGLAAFRIIRKPNAVKKIEISDKERLAAIESWLNRNFSDWRNN